MLEYHYIDHVIWSNYDIISESTQIWSLRAGGNL